MFIQFYYTDRIVEINNEKDPIMISINGYALKTTLIVLKAI